LKLETTQFARFELDPYLPDIFKQLQEKAKREGIKVSHRNRTKKEKNRRVLTVQAFTRPAKESLLKMARLVRKYVEVCVAVWDLNGEDITKVEKPEWVLPEGMTEDDTVVRQQAPTRAARGPSRRRKTTKGKPTAGVTAVGEMPSVGVATAGRVTLAEAPLSTGPQSDAPWLSLVTESFNYRVCTDRPNCNFYIAVTGAVALNLEVTPEEVGLKRWAQFLDTHDVRVGLYAGQHPSTWGKQHHMCFDLTDLVNDIINNKCHQFVPGCRVVRPQCCP
jgi:hypothetical protein